MSHIVCPPVFMTWTLATRSRRSAMGTRERRGAVAVERVELALDAPVEPRDVLRREVVHVAADLAAPGLEGLRVVRLAGRERRAVRGPGRFTLLHRPEAAVLDRGAHRRVSDAVEAQECSDAAELARRVGVQVLVAHEEEVAWHVALGGPHVVVTEHPLEGPAWPVHVGRHVALEP